MLDQDLMRDEIAGIARKLEQHLEPPVLGTSARPEGGPVAQLADAERAAREIRLKIDIVGWPRPTHHGAHAGDEHEVADWPADVVISATFQGVEERHLVRLRVRSR